MRKRDSEAISAALLCAVYELALGIARAIRWAVPIVARQGRIVARQGWENAPAAKRGLGAFAGWIVAPFRWLFSVRNDFAGDGSSSSTPLGFTAKLVTIACLLGLGREQLPDLASCYDTGPWDRRGTSGRPAWSSTQRQSNG